MASRGGCIWGNAGKRVHIAGGRERRGLLAGVCVAVFCVFVTHPAAAGQSPGLVMQEAPRTQGLSSAHVSSTQSTHSVHFVLVQGKSDNESRGGHGDRASLPADFYIGRYEVTAAEWLRVLQHAGRYGFAFESDYEASGTNHPVVNVNWYDCVKWCNLRSEVEGKQPVYTAGGEIYRSGRRDDVVAAAVANGYRLPTSDEWGFAARGGVRSKSFIYSGSDDLDEVGWYVGNSSGAAVNMHGGRGTWPVGLKLPNELSLFDMSGNATEWCFDWHPDYPGLMRIRRGGSWKYSMAYCRVATVYMNGPKFAGDTMGFRCAMTAIEGQD